VRASRYPLGSWGGHGGRSSRWSACEQAGIATHGAPCAPYSALDERVIGPGGRA